MAVTRSSRIFAGNTTFLNDVTILGSIVFGDVGVDTFTIAGYMQGSATGNTSVNIGNGTPDKITASTYDLYVTDELEVGGASWFDGASTWTNLASGEASVAVVSLVNSTAATVAVNQYSPSLYMRGSGWKINATAESQYCDGRIFMAPADYGTNAIPTMALEVRVDEGAWASIITFNPYGVQHNVSAYFNENTIFASNRQIFLNSATDTGFIYSTPQTVDSLLFFLDSTSRTCILQIILMQ